MKCVYCQEKSGFLRRFCQDCQKVLDVIRKAPSSFGYRELLDQLLSTTVAPTKIEKVLDTDLDGAGSINDHLTARMTNEIMTSLGQPTNMTGPAVKQVRHDIQAGKAPSQMDHEVIGHVHQDISEKS